MALVVVVGCARSGPPSAAPDASGASSCSGVEIADAAGHVVRHVAFRAWAPPEQAPFIGAKCPDGSAMWLSGSDNELLAVCVANGAAPSVVQVILRTEMEHGKPPRPPSGASAPMATQNWWTGEATIAEPRPASGACVPVEAKIELRERAIASSMLGVLGPRTVTVRGTFEPR